MTSDSAQLRVGQIVTALRTGIIFLGILALTVFWIYLSFHTIQWLLSLL